MMRKYIERCSKYHVIWLCIEPEDKTSVKALMVIIHGLGEHSGRYIEYVQQFARQGVCTYTMDLRGHGKSPGREAMPHPDVLSLKMWIVFATMPKKTIPMFPCLYTATVWVVT